MAEKKLITIEVKDEALNAFQSILFDELSGDMREVAKARACSLLNSLSIAFDNPYANTNTPKDLEEAIRIIEVQRNRIFHLEREEVSFPLRLHEALAALLKHDPIYQLHPPANVNVFDDDFKIFRRQVPIMAEDIICIVSVEKKRKKAIYIKVESDDLTVSVKRLFINNEDNMEDLCKLFDRLSHRLIKVSKRAIVNVAFYNIAEDNYLRITPSEHELLTDVTEIKISDNKSEYDTFKKDFIKVKDIYRQHILTQWRILCYNRLVELAYPDVSFEETFL